MDERELADARQQLDEQGYVVVEDALDPDAVGALRARLIEQAAGERAAGVAHLEWGGANQRIWQLPAKGRVFLDLLCHPLLDELMGYLLGHNALVSSLTANIAGKGGEEMFLHADQGYLPFWTPSPVVANVAWMLSDFTEENGATRIVPGSHLREELHERTGGPDRAETIAATGRAGSALVFDGRLWHGTGKNTTDELRYVVLSYHCRPWIRQQENHFLALPEELVAKLDEPLRARLGWKMWAGLGKTGQGQQSGDVFVERLADPVLELAADGTPFG